MSQDIFHKPLFLVALLIAAGTILGFQLFFLDDISLWHDEAFSALLVQYDFGEMMHRIGLDVHPPLYYIILRVWTDLFGSSLITLRLFSMFFGLLVAAGTYFLAKTLFNKRSLAILASLLVFFNAFQIQYQMEARMYTLASFFVVASTLFLVCALRRKAPHSIIWWLAYAATASAGIYTHYYVAFILIAQGLFVLYTIAHNTRSFSPLSWVRNTHFHFFFLSSSLITISYLPWLPTFWSQLRQVQDAFWIPPINLWSIPSTLFKMFTGFGIDPYRFSLPLVAGSTFVIVGMMIFFVLIRYRKQEKWLLVSSLVVPFAAAALVSLQTSLYLDRYFILFLPFLLTIVAAAILAIPVSLIRHTLIGLVLIATFISYPIYWQSLNVQGKPGMAEAAEYLKKSVNQTDKLFVNSSFVYFTFRYYNQTPIRPLLYAPSKLLHFSGTALLQEKDIVKSFQDATNKGDIVWTLDTTGFGNFQPTVPQSWAKESEVIVGDVPDFKGEIIVRKYIVQ